MEICSPMPSKQVMVIAPMAIFLAIRTGWLIDDSGQSIGLKLATKTKKYDSILGMDGKQNKSDDYIIKRTFFMAVIISSHQHSILKSHPHMQ